jgi:hypothetical protein
MARGLESRRKPLTVDVIGRVEQGVAKQMGMWISSVHGPSLSEVNKMKCYNITLPACNPLDTGGSRG